MPRKESDNHPIVQDYTDNVISINEFNQLTVSEQLTILRTFHGKEKHDLLISSRYAEKLVSQLHPQEIYLTINTIGAADVSELLALCSGEQINLLLDLDCWDGDVLSPVLSLHWLELLLTTGRDKVRRLITELDPEVLALFLKKHLTITHGIEVFDSDDHDNAKRLEALYDIDYASEEAAKTIGAMLKIWFEEEQESYLLVMEMIRSEMLSTLEEEIFQARSNRLSDIGIVPTHEAQKIYTMIDVENFQPGGKRGFELESEELGTPMALLNRARPDNLLAEVLANGLDHATASELLMLANRKISADRIDISSAEEVGSAIQATFDILNLALEYLAGVDADKAEQLFTTTWLVELFQLGHSLLIKRQHQAHAISQTALYARFDYPELLFIDSLLEQPAFLYLTGSEDGQSQLLPIRTVQHLSLVDQRMEQISALVDLFSNKLPFEIAAVDAEEDDPASLAVLFNTALANQLLQRPFSPTPLTAGDLKQLEQAILEDAKLTDSFAIQVKQHLVAINTQLNFFSTYCLELWEESLVDFSEQGVTSNITGLLID